MVHSVHALSHLCDQLDIVERRASESWKVLLWTVVDCSTMSWDSPRIELDLGLGLGLDNSYTHEH